MINLYEIDEKVRKTNKYVIEYELLMKRVEWVNNSEFESFFKNINEKHIETTFSCTLPHIWENFKETVEKKYKKYGTPNFHLKNLNLKKNFKENLEFKNVDRKKTFLLAYEKIKEDFSEEQIITTVKHTSHPSFFALVSYYLSEFSLKNYFSLEQILTLLKNSEDKHLTLRLTLAYHIGEWMKIKGFSPDSMIEFLSVPIKIPEDYLNIFIEFIENWEKINKSEQNQVSYIEQYIHKAKQAANNLSLYNNASTTSSIVEKDKLTTNSSIPKRSYAQSDEMTSKRLKTSDVSSPIVSYSNILSSPRSPLLSPSFKESEQVRSDSPFHLDFNSFSPLIDFPSDSFPLLSELISQNNLEKLATCNPTQLDPSIDPSIIPLIPPNLHSSSSIQPVSPQRQLTQDSSDFFIEKKSFSLFSTSEDQDRTVFCLDPLKSLPDPFRPK